MLFLDREKAAALLENVEIALKKTQQLEMTSVTSQATAITDDEEWRTNVELCIQERPDRQMPCRPDAQLSDTRSGTSQTRRSG